MDVVDCARARDWLGWLHYRATAFLVSESICNWGLPQKAFSKNGVPKTKRQKRKKAFPSLVEPVFRDPIFCGADPNYERGGCHL